MTFLQGVSSQDDVTPHALSGPVESGRNPAKRTSSFDTSIAGPSLVASVVVGESQKFQADFGLQRIKSWNTKTVVALVLRGLLYSRFCCLL